MNVKRAISLFCLLTSLGCQVQPEVNETKNNQAIIDTLAILANQFSQAYIEGDVATMVSVYTNDAVIFPNNAEYIRGKEAIERYWKLPKGRRITHHKLIPKEIEVSGSMASDFGHYEISGENDGKAWGPVYGKYLVVWKRGDDGLWRMHLDMWNSRPRP